MKISVSEEFYSLQGEGRHAGMAAYFVRLAGCDVGCSWCDSKESWRSGVLCDVREIAARAASSGTMAVVVTGGEPLMQPLDELTRTLHDRGLAVHLETSGTHPQSGDFDWICLSPKPHRPPLDAIFSCASELKVVVASSDDFEWAERCAERCGRQALLYLQVEWRGEMMTQVVDYIKQNPRWKLSLQTHKFTGIR